MNNPPPIPPPPPPPLPEITLANQIKDLISYKKRWDAVEKELSDLRDGLKISGRINQKDKAMMLLHLESGHNLFQVIQQNYPQYLNQQQVYQPIPKKKGCLGIVLLTLIPMTSLAGWLVSQKALLIGIGSMSSL
jgi:hypothetical protein